MILQIDPARFTMLGEASSVYLVDMVLKLDGRELQRVDEAWSSGDLDPQAFKSGTGGQISPSEFGSFGNGSDTLYNGTIRKVDGKAVIG
jgi:hypothetical protein